MAGVWRAVVTGICLSGLGGEEQGMGGRGPGGEGQGTGCSSEAGHSRPHPSSFPARPHISLLVALILVVTLIIVGSVTLYLNPRSVGQHRAKGLPL